MLEYLGLLHRKGINNDLFAYSKHSFHQLHPYISKTTESQLNIKGRNSEQESQGSGANFYVNDF